jgi:uncharacterized membrane protein
MRNKRVKEMSFTAVLAAMVILMAVVPNLGYIAITPMVGLTIIHIPVFIGAYFGGRRVGASLGLVFGLTSFIVALTRPQGLLDPIFTNPLVSVLPRFLVGYFAVDVLNFFQKRFSKKVLADALYFGGMTLLHSMIVIPLIYIVAQTGLYFDVYGLLSEFLTNQALAVDPNAAEVVVTSADTLGVVKYVSDYYILGSGFFGFLMTILIVNSLLEVVACVLVGTPIAKRLKDAISLD